LSKESLININSLHLDFLKPLTDWRILDMQSLREECDYRYHTTSFEKLIRRLERSNIVKSFKDPLNNRKFIYLSTLGENLIGAKRKTSISEETMFHDSRVTLITRELLERSCFQRSELEHQIGNSSMAFVPDAALIGEKNGVSFKLAFELELTRKSKDRIKSKLSHYLGNDYYNYIFYMFCNEGVMQSYLKNIEENFNDDALSRVILMTNKTIMSRKMKLSESFGYFKKKEVCIDDLF
jgi:hypothetical protein